MARFYRGHHRRHVVVVIVIAVSIVLLGLPLQSSSSFYIYIYYFPTIELYILYLCAQLMGELFASTTYSHMNTHIQAGRQAGTHRHSPDLDRQNVVTEFLSFPQNLHTHTHGAQVFVSSFIRLFVCSHDKNQLFYYYYFYNLSFVLSTLVKLDVRRFITVAERKTMQMRENNNLTTKTSYSEKF